MVTTQLYLTNLGLINACQFMPNEIRWLGLYQNPVPLAKGFDPTLLIEATFSGYAQIHLDNTLWSAPPVIDSDGNATITYPEVTFTKMGATANPTIWGFFLKNPAGSIYFFAQEFAAAPYPMVADGDLLRLTPKFSVGNPIFP